MIMGETGCGKTRLIRFMCDLVVQYVLDHAQESIKNMLVMKVQVKINIHAHTHTHTHAHAHTYHMALYFIRYMVVQLKEIL